MISRVSHLEQLSAALKRSPITALLGPRQSGKSALVRLFVEKQKATYFDLESLADQRRLQNPEMMLGKTEGIVILDGIQVMPHLGNVLPHLVDRPGNKTRFLILGTASPGLIKPISRSLTGRVVTVLLSGLDLLEIGVDSWQRLWVRGGFPGSFFAESGDDSFLWRENYIRNFLERDITQLGSSIPAPILRRFWLMLANDHGQIWNASKLARSMGLSDKTVRSYLEILTNTFMVRQLRPWNENIAKRQVKAPKIYIRDSGLLHSLLGLADYHGLTGHPQVAASWEGFVVEQVFQALKLSEAFFWATHNGAEIDIFFADTDRRYGVEITFSEAPSLTKSMQIAIDDLDITHLWVIYPGQNIFPLHKKITALPLTKIAYLPLQIR